MARTYLTKSGNERIYFLTLVNMNKADITGDTFEIFHNNDCLLEFHLVTEYAILLRNYTHAFRPCVIYCRVLVKKCPRCLFNLVEIHCTCHQLLSRPCYLFSGILLVCIEGRHEVIRTLNSFTPGPLGFEPGGHIYCCEFGT